MILWNMEKSLAYQIFYWAMKKIQQKTKTNLLLVLCQAIRRVTPNIRVKTRRNKGVKTSVILGQREYTTLSVKWA
jgi:small subunit ribosomal protein S7